MISCDLIIFPSSRLKKIPYAIPNSISNYRLAAYRVIYNAHVHPARHVFRAPLPTVKNRGSSPRSLFHQLVLLQCDSSVPVIDRKVGGICNFLT
jgi:hypothetical protein